jgi:hypothetical protein
MAERGTEMLFSIRITSLREAHSQVTITLAFCRSRCVCFTPAALRPLCTSFSEFHLRYPAITNTLEFLLCLRC